MERWRIACAALMASALLASGGQALAAGEVPMTPEKAAKAEVVRKQQQQRITPEQRKAAAEALKAERLKVHNARQGNPSPGNEEKK